MCKLFYFLWWSRYLKSCSPSNTFILSQYQPYLLTAWCVSRVCLFKGFDKDKNGRLFHFIVQFSNLIYSYLLWSIENCNPKRHFVCKHNDHHRPRKIYTELENCIINCNAWPNKPADLSTCITDWLSLCLHAWPFAYLFLSSLSFQFPPSMGQCNPPSRHTNLACCELFLFFISITAVWLAEFVQKYCHYEHSRQCYSKWCPHQYPDLQYLRIFLDFYYILHI